MQRLVDLGPHPAGSDAIEKAREYIEAQLRRWGLAGNTPGIHRRHATRQNSLCKSDCLARFGGDANPASPSLLLCSHYDTKLFDTIRFVGANDGGSSTGMLLEIARVLGQHPSLARKVELAFFDGEEACKIFLLRIVCTEAATLPGNSKAMAQNNFARNFVDMVGDRSLGITLPPDSPSAMANDIFAAAEALKLRKYFSYFDRDLNDFDDHTPLNAVGIPTIDIIDFDYPSWHTADDTIDKISAQSLQTVGSVALSYLAEFAFKR